MPKLKAPKKIASVSFGGKEYAVDKTGFFTVPKEAVAELVESHGFGSDAEADDAGASNAGGDTAGGGNGGAAS